MPSAGAWSLQQRECRRQRKFRWQLRLCFHRSCPAHRRSKGFPIESGTPMRVTSASERSSLNSAKSNQIVKKKGAVERTGAARLYSMTKQKNKTTFAFFRGQDNIFAGRSGVLTLSKPAHPRAASREMFPKLTPKY